ncbi:hypothetical protein WI25_07085 [Burkholderia cepacia]|nr:hypothetical protein WI25_07085 [Burkholderia cepacia]
MVGRLAHAEIADEGQRAYGVDYAQRGVTGIGWAGRFARTGKRSYATASRRAGAAASGGAPRGQHGAMFARISAERPADFAIGHLTDGGRRGRLRYSAHWRSGRRRIRIRMADILRAGRNDVSM